MNPIATNINYLPATSDSSIVLTNSYSSSLHQALIEAAIAAPSADNNQPWKFKSGENWIAVYWDLSKKLPSDVDGMFDLMALGAAIENIVVKLQSLGYKAELQLAEIACKDTQNNTAQIRQIAKITFAKHEAENNTHEKLAGYISARRTTRDTYSTKPIPQDQLQEITAASVQHDDIKLCWMTDRAKINSLASLVALSDSLRFRYRDFHEELHRQLRLSAAHAEQTRDGLDYRTLGLPLGGRTVLRLIRSWQTMSLLSKFGMASLMAAPSKRLVRNSGAIGLIYLDTRTPHSMIRGGQTMQRMWRHATQLGLSVHPLGSLPVFLANNNLPTELLPIVKQIRTNAQQVLPPSRSLLQMAFRIGIPKKQAPSSIRSLRYKPQNVTL